MGVFFFLHAPTIGFTLCHSGRWNFGVRFFASHALCAVMRARIKEEYLGLCVEAIAAVLSMRGPCDGDAGGIYSSLFRMWSDSLDRIERVAEHVSACDLLLVMHV